MVVPLLAHVVVAHRIFVIGECAELFLDVCYVSRGGILIVESLGVELVGGESSGEEVLELLLQEHLLHLVLERHPVAAELQSLLLVETVFHRVESHVVKSGCALHAELLLDHGVEIRRTAAEHSVGQLGVGHGKTESLELVLIKFLSHHAVEHLLLEKSLVDFLTALLSLLVSLLQAALEVLNFDFLPVHLRHGCAGAEECAAGSKEVTDDERYQGGTDDHEQKH